MAQPPKALARWIKEHLFNAVPMAVGAIDKEFNLVYANDAFEQMFGPWQGRKCYQVYKGQDDLCVSCKGAKAFEQGRPMVNEEIGYDKEGQLTRYIKHTVPVVTDEGDIPYLLEMSMDVTESEQIRREYQLLFDQVPCSILLIDRDYRIVKTNERAHKLLGNLEGLHCYSGLKGLDSKCKECTARKTFADGNMHTGHHSWRTKGGETVHLHVITVPLRLTNGTFDMVMEMAVDVTQTMQLQDGLGFAHSFLETMIGTAMDGIFAVDVQGDVTICNPAARKFFALRPDEKLSRQELAGMLPEGYLHRAITGQRQIYLPETVISDAAGCQKPVRLEGHQMTIEGRPVGTAFWIQDLSEIKGLEDEKLAAERLAAVGQTVAGLAHGIKNLTAALDGGMYMLSSGIEKGDVDRVQKGMVMLDRNTQRIARFTKAFLHYAKGRRIRTKMTDPTAVVKEVVEDYVATADELGIQIVYEQLKPLAPAAIDHERLHEGLANLVGNAIDACKESTSGGSLIVVRVFEKKGIIFYEVTDDGCGMDEEVQRKVFNTFFTTKGLSGTGLGLLMTRKIIQEHGGYIRVRSKPEKGTTFRVSLPRKRLPQVVDAIRQEAPGVGS